MQNRVLPARSELCHRLENKAAQVHARVRQDELGRIDNGIVYGYQININGAVGVSSGGTAVAGGGDGVLYGLQGLMHLYWSFAGQGFKRHTYVEKKISGLVAPWLGFNHGA